MPQIQSGSSPEGMVNPLFGKAADANTPEENARVKDVMQMFVKAKQWKQTWAKDYARWDNLWESNHYKGRVATTLTQAVINQVWSSIETFMGHIIDALPEPIARARRPDLKPKAALLTKWLKYEADVNDLEQEVQHPVRQSCKRGAGWFKVVWDEQKLGNRGDASILPVDDNFMFPAPYARNMKDLPYLIEARNIPRDFVLRNFEKGALVPPGTQDGSLANLSAFSDERKAGSASPNAALLTTTTGSDSRWSSSTGVVGGKRGDLVTYIEAWTREQDGSMRLTIIANGVMLQDGPSPYDDEDYQHVVVNIIPTLDTIQGRGLCQFIEGLQDILNESVSLLIDQQRFASDPMLVVDSVNLEEGNLIENSPGAILPNVSQRGDGYSWLTAPGFNQAWVEVQRLVSDYMDSVLGRVDVLKGERPAGVNTLGGLEIVRDEANVRIRNLIRWVKASLKRVYLLVLSRLRQFAKDERHIRIVGKAGQEDFATVNEVQGVGLDGGVAQDMTIPDDAEFDVEFAKEAPGGRQARIELALQLASTPAQDGLPMVDRQYVLETCDIEEGPEIMQRLMEEQQAQQEAQMAAEQQAAGAQPGAAPPAEGDPLDALVQQLMAGQMAADRGGQAA